MTNLCVCVCVCVTGMQRIVSGDLAELASLLSRATRPLTLDLANRTFSSAAWRGVLVLRVAGMTLSGGTIVLRPGQKVRFDTHMNTHTHT